VGVSNQMTNQNVYFGQYNIDAEGMPDRANVITALSPQQYDQTLTALINEEQESGVAGRPAVCWTGPRLTTMVRCAGPKRNDEREQGNGYNCIYRWTMVKLGLERQRRTASTTILQLPRGGL